MVLPLARAAVLSTGLRVREGRLRVQLRPVLRVQRDQAGPRLLVRLLVRVRVRVRVRVSPNPNPNLNPNPNPNPNPNSNPNPNLNPNPNPNLLRARQPGAQRECGREAVGRPPHLWRLAGRGEVDALEAIRKPGLGLGLGLGLVPGLGLGFGLGLG